jgi:hypothetical protein
VPNQDKSVEFRANPRDLPTMRLCDTAHIMDELVKLLKRCVSFPKQVSL